MIEGAGLRVELATYFNMLSFPLALSRRVSQRIVHRVHYEELKLPPATMNALLRYVFELERSVLRNAGPNGLLAFGLSVVAIGRASANA